MVAMATIAVTLRVVSGERLGGIWPDMLRRSSQGPLKSYEWFSVALGLSVYCLFNSRGEESRPGQARSGNGLNGRIVMSMSHHAASSSPVHISFKRPGHFTAQSQASTKTGLYVDRLQQFCPKVRD